MNLAFWRRDPPAEQTRGLSSYEWMLYNSVSYPIGLNQTNPGAKQEPIGGDFRGLAHGAYAQNGVVFACMLVRMLLFSEARFQYRQRRSGRPGDLFGTDELALLEEPWPGGTTGDLLARALQDVDLAGNWFCLRRPGELVRLRPDWVTIVAGSPREDATLWDPDVQVVGYQYTPGGPGSGNEPESYLREQVAHFAPIPDPLSRFRGMSWLTPVIREIMSDGAATDHKLSFFEKGATINLAIKINTNDADKFSAAVAKFKSAHEGVGGNPTLFFNQMMEPPIPIGTNMEQMDFKNVQGAGETRIAAAAGVPPVIVGLSEGLQAATYSNYSQARRRFADGTMRPLWRNIAGSLSQIIRVPPGSELWYDDRDIPFLAEDVKDAAEVQQLQSVSMATLAKEGWLPDSIVDAVAAGDWKRLKHSGLTSIQVQPAAPPPNGNGKPDEAAVKPPAPALRRLAEELERQASRDGEDT